MTNAPLFPIDSHVSIKTQYGRTWQVKVAYQPFSGTEPTAEWRYGLVTLEGDLTETCNESQLEAVNAS